MIQDHFNRIPRLLTMPHPNIDLDDDARLPFMKSPYGVADEDDPAEGDEDAMDHPTALERMQDAIPPDAIELGCLEYEIDHSPGLSWRIEDHFYLIPINPAAGAWSVIRVTWDDNWGRYDWSKDATGKGFADAKDAARAMVKALFDRWHGDAEEEESPAAEARHAFLSRL
jgi:hypothetical protein